MSRLAALCVVLAVLWWYAPKSPPEASPVKRCAAALVTLEMAAECTQFNAVNDSCAFTMADLQAVREAGAEKQNYCPVLREGEEGANQ